MAATTTPEADEKREEAEELGGGAEGVGKGEGPSDP